MQKWIDFGNTLVNLEKITGFTFENQSNRAYYKICAIANDSIIAELPVFPENNNREELNRRFTNIRNAITVFVQDSQKILDLTEL